MGAVFPGEKKEELSADERTQALEEAAKVYLDSRCTREAPRHWKVIKPLEVHEGTLPDKKFRGETLQVGKTFKGWKISLESETDGEQQGHRDWVRIEGNRGTRRFVKVLPGGLEDKSQVLPGGLEDKSRWPAEETRWEPWPLWATSEDLGEYYGPGVRLHFRWLGLLSAVSLAAAMLALPLVYFSTLGAALDPFLTGSEGWLRENLLRTTLGNLGTEDLELHGVWVKSSHVTGHAGMQDALAVLLVFAAAVWFERVCIRDAVQDEWNRFVTAGDFTLQVTRLPPRLKENTAAGRKEGEGCPYQEALRAHFDGLLSASVTAENVKKGLAVVRADDKGDNSQQAGTAAGGGWRRLRDHRGRRLGRVVRLHKGGHEVEVQWARSSKVPPERHRLVGEDGGVVLRHVPLLLALESHGLDAGENLGTRTCVQEVALVHKGGYEQLSLMAKKNKDLMAKENKETAATHTVKDFNNKCRELGVLSAYVIFTRVKYRDFLEQAYRFSHFRPGRWMQPKHHRFQDSAIEVGEAPVPGDIMWENLDLDWRWQCLRKVISLLACFALLSVIIIFLTMANNALEDAKPNLSCEEEELHVDLSAPIEESLSSGVAKDCICRAIGYSNIWHDTPAGSTSLCEEWVKTQAKAGALFAVVCTLPTILSLVGGTIIEKLATMERSPSRTSLNNSILVMSCCLNVLYCGALQVILNRHELDSSQGFFDFTPEWFALVGCQVLVTLFATLFYPLLGAIPCVGFHFSRWRSRSSSKCSKEDLRKSHTPPHFPIAVQEAATLSELIATLLFSCCMPVLWFFALLRVPLYYAMDKWVLLRGCHRPPRFDHHMASSVAKCVQVAAWLHSLLAVWTYGNPNLMVSAANFDVTTNLDGTAAGGISLLEEFLARQRRAPAFPNFLVLCGISLASLLRLALFIQGESSHYSLSLLGALCGSSRGSGGGKAPGGGRGGAGLLSQEFSEGPLKSMQGRKLITSYEMGQNVRNPDGGKALSPDHDIEAPSGQARRSTGAASTRKKSTRKPTKSRRRSSRKAEAGPAEAGVAVSERL